MRKKLLFLLLFSCAALFAQDQRDSFTHFIVPEFLYGNLVPANTNFPETNSQTGFLISFGKSYDNSQEWAYRLNRPKTGITLGVNDLGNSEKVGYAFSILPFIEFDLFRKRKKDLHLQIGMGASYFNKRFDSITNPLNQGVTTRFTWSFRMFMYFDILKRKQVDWRIGGGYYHHSNGHTRLPNQGFNSFLISASAQIKYKKEQTPVTASEASQKITYTKSSNYFFDLRTGVGQNVLSEEINDKREVYALALSGGKVINSTYKLGFGMYYRYYEHYNDYIEANEGLIPEFYPDFPNQSFLKASNFGLFASAEFLLNHVGVEINLGYNLYKPAYDIDWQLNEGYTYTLDFGNGPVMFTVLGDLESTKFKVKKQVMSRLGLKYYIFGTASKPIHNFYLGAHLNANLGQADFTELSFGYVYSFSFR